MTRLTIPFEHTARRIARNLMFLACAARHPRIYRLGRSEAHHALGMTYGDPESRKSTAYDMGRNHGEGIYFI